MSVSKITDTGHEVNFKKNAAYITNNLGEIVVVAKRQGDLYYVKELQEETNIAETDLKYKSTLMTWHQKLRHLNEANLKEMQENGVVLGLKIPKNEKLKICEVCIKGKQTQNAFPHSERKSTTLLEMVHTDICGPIRTKSIGGSRYFAIFIDDFSRWCVVHFLLKKSEVFEAFKQFTTYAENITGKTILCHYIQTGCANRRTHFYRRFYI